MEGPSEAKMSCVDNKDGSCSVEYVPYEPGTYNLNITYGGQPITGKTSALGDGCFCWRRLISISLDFHPPSDWGGGRRGSLTFSDLVYVQGVRSQFLSVTLWTAPRSSARGLAWATMSGPQSLKHSQ